MKDSVSNDMHSISYETHRNAGCICFTNVNETADRRNVTLNPLEKQWSIKEYKREKCLQNTTKMRNHQRVAKERLLSSSSPKIACYYFKTSGKTQVK